MDKRLVDVPVDADHAALGQVAQPAQFPATRGPLVNKPGSMTATRAEPITIVVSRHGGERRGVH